MGLAPRRNFFCSGHSTSKCFRRCRHGRENFQPPFNNKQFFWFAVLAAQKTMRCRKTKRTFFPGIRTVWTNFLFLKNAKFKMSGKMMGGKNSKFKKKQNGRLVVFRADNIHNPVVLFVIWPAPQWVLNWCSCMMLLKSLLRGWKMGWLEKRLLTVGVPGLVGAGTRANPRSNQVPKNRSCKSAPKNCQLCKKSIF